MIVGRDPARRDHGRRSVGAEPRAYADRKLTERRRRRPSRLSSPASPRERRKRRPQGRGIAAARQGGAGTSRLPGEASPGKRNFNPVVPFLRPPCSLRRRDGQAHTRENVHPAALRRELQQRGGYVIYPLSVRTLIWRMGETMRDKLLGVVTAIVVGLVPRHWLWRRTCHRAVRAQAGAAWAAEQQGARPEARWAAQRARPRAGRRSAALPRVPSLAGWLGLPPRWRASPPAHRAAAAAAIRPRPRPRHAERPARSRAMCRSFVFQAARR